MSLNALLIINTVVLFVLGVFWNKEDLKNIVLKIILMVLFVGNMLATLIHCGLLVSK